MKKVAVLGVGRMGQAICYAAKKLNFEVVGLDSYADAAYDFRKYIEGSDGAFYLLDDEKTFDRALLFEKPDVVISSLPYHQTEKVARWCIDAGFRYCDLGGRVDVSRRINEYATEKATLPVFTDLGLAPGWVNILAEHGCNQFGGTADTVKMMVGGLPASKINRPLDYVVTWSVDGLINEYKDDCEVLDGGELKIVEGMSNLESVSCATLGNLEAFCTSGGASHTIQSMKERGVTNCYYKTLRYEGHRDIVRFLLKNQDEKCVREAFESGCKNPKKVADVVLVKAFVYSGGSEWKKELAVEGNPEGFSAMQQATAFPMTSVATLMAEGMFDNLSSPRRLNLSYGDVPLDRMNERLVRLGLNVS